MTEKIQITSEEDVLVYEDRVERVRCEMFQMVLINRVMERRELELPASGDEIREVYDQLKGKKGARRIEIAELKTSIPELNECLQGSNVNRRTLSELDFLARRVQQMTEREREIFKTAAGFSRELSLAYLINLSYNLGCYSFYSDVFTEGELGKYLAQNGYEGMSDGCERPVDWIGEQYHQAHMGKFTKHGYVVKNEKAIIPLYDGKNFPDLYAVLPDSTGSMLELHFSRAGNVYGLHLPVKELQISCLEHFLGVNCLDSWPFYYAKEKFPGLRKYLPCRITIRELNRFVEAAAPWLEKEPQKADLMFAALEAEMPLDIQQAIHIAENLDSYQFLQRMGKGTVKTSLGILKSKNHEFPALSDELRTIRLFSPLSAHCYGKYRFNGKTEYEECPVRWDGYSLVSYQETIRKALNKECKWLGKSGLAEFLNNALLKRKIAYMMPGVEEWNRRLWGVLEVKSYGALSERELQEVIEEWKGQCSDGFGEGFSQREIRIQEGILYVHFCGSLWNFEVQTEQQLKGKLEKSQGIQWGSLQ